jgi:hypothetical protein
MIEPRLSDAELLRQIEAARAADAQADLTEPRARDAWYNPTDGLVHVHLKNGTRFSFPPSFLPEIEGATEHSLIRIEVSPSGDALYWDEIDVHVATAGILVKMLGPSMFRAFASIGGTTKSERKAAAARANGLKGGRPRKQGKVVEFRPDPHFGEMKVAERPYFGPPTPRVEPLPDDER